MDKMMSSGINMRKSIAMGEHERMYGAGKGGYGKPKPKPTSGPPKGPKPLKMGGRHPDRESAAEDRTETAADEAAESYTERLY